MLENRGSAVRYAQYATRRLRVQREASSTWRNNQQPTLVLSVAEVTNIKKPQTHIPITKIISRTQKRFLYTHIYRRLFSLRRTTHQRIVLVFS